MKSLIAMILFVLAFAGASLAADTTAPDPVRDRAMRERYEAVLLRNPFQERSFSAVYEGYSAQEGVDVWSEKLKSIIARNDTNSLNALLLLGQVYDRQFKTAEAIAAFEQAAAKGESRPQFKVLLGTLDYRAGKDEPAARLLSEALEQVTDLDQRSAICRILGNLYLRQGKRDEAIAIWKRIAGKNTDDTFAQSELADIYQDNRMWEEAVEVYRKIAEASKDDPYRRCRALRSAGECLILDGKSKEAIATFEEGLGLVAPGTWLFEDLAMRLIGVYEDLGDLAGLVKYLQARLEKDQNDTDSRGLLAETYTRMGKLDLAEQEYRSVLEHSPRNTSAYEKLIALYSRLQRTKEQFQTFEKLIALYPNETEYVRRLGEAYLRGGDRTNAITTWRRIVARTASAERRAELAGWLENAGFNNEAIAAFEEALQNSRNKEWVFRLAALKFKTGADADAVKLWLSVLDTPTCTAAECVEVATLLEANQKFEPAEIVRKQSIEKDPKDMELRLSYARNLMQQRKFEMALAEFDTIAGQEESEFLRTEAERGRLDAYAELGLLSDKQAEWERQLEQNPKSPRLLAQLAQLYSREGRKEKAVEFYERRRDVEPDNPVYLRDLAAAYRAAHQESQAIDTYRKLAANDKSRARAYLKNLLELYLASDSRAEAIATGEKLVELTPSDPETRIELAKVYGVYHESNKALEQYRVAIQLKPSEATYHREYADALAAAQRWGESQTAYRKALDIAQDDESRLAIVQALARVYSQQGKLDELTGEFNRRIRDTPKRMAAYEELAAIYEESRDPARAIQVLERGVQEVDDKLPALKSLIRVAYEARDYRKVRSAFEQMILLSGRPSIAEYERLASLYVQSGDTVKAIETWKKIVDLAGNDPKALRRAAAGMRHDGFNDDAMAALSKAIGVDPYDYQSRFEYAQMLASANQPSTALTQLEKLLELGERKGSRPAFNRSFGRGGSATLSLSAILRALMASPGRNLQSILSQPGGVQSLAGIGSSLQAVTTSSGQIIYLQQGPSGAIQIQPAGASASFPVISNFLSQPFSPTPSRGVSRGTTASQSRGPTGVNTVSSGFGSASRGGRGGLGFNAWQGSFEDFKPQVMLFAAELARSTGAEESYLKPFQERVSKEPNNVEAKRELLLVSLACNRPTQSLGIAEEILAANTNDYAFHQSTAQLYSSFGRLDRAVPLYEALLDAGPPYKEQALQALVPLYLRNNQQEKGMALVNQFLTDGTAARDVNVILSLGNSLQSLGRMDLAKSIYQKGIDSAGANRGMLLMNLANLYRQSGDGAGAKATYVKLIFAEPNPVSSPVASRFSMVFSPIRLAPFSASPAPRGASPAAATSLARSRMLSVLSSFSSTPDSMKLSAFTSLLALQNDSSGASFQSLVSQVAPGQTYSIAPGSSNVLSELAQQVQKLKTSTNQTERAGLWEGVEIVFAYHIAEGDLTAAGNFLESTREPQKEDDRWLNLALYLEDRKENFAGMVPYYDQIAARNPSRAREALIAKSKALAFAGQWESVASTIKTIPQPKPSSAEIISIVQMQQPSPRDRGFARSIIEEALAAGGRDTDLLVALARNYAADGNYPRAIELAEEAWRARPRPTSAVPLLSMSGSTRTTSNPLSGSTGSIAAFSGSPVIYTLVPRTDAVLGDLHRYYVAQGKRAELVDQFAKRVEEQPDAAWAYEDLAALYRIDGQTDKVMEVNKKLLKKDPRSVSARLAMANALIDQGDYVKAISGYEEIQRTNPELASQLDTPLRTLRQRAGVGGTGGSQGMQISPNSLGMPSDRNIKTNFGAVDVQAILAKVALLPLTSWNYKSDLESRHIGPMAQDFSAAFGLGSGDTQIAVVDEGGVALAAIQGLGQKLAEKEARIHALEKTVSELNELVQTLVTNANRGMTSK